MKTHPRVVIQKSESSAFTLVEMMMATALTSVFGIMLLSVLLGVLTSWQSTESRIDAYREARASLKMLAREFSTYIPEAPGVTRADTLQIVTNSPSSVRFMTRLPAAVQPNGTPAVSLSDVCGVDYFVAPPADAPQGPTGLYRRMIPSNEMFTRLAAGGNLFPGTSSSASSHVELVAANVVDFKARFLAADLTELPQPLTEDTVPVFVEFEMVVLAAKPAALFFDPDTPAEVKAHILDQDSRTFNVRHSL